MVRKHTLYDFNPLTVRLVLRPNTWSILETVPRVHEKNVYSAVIGDVLYRGVLGLVHLQH